METAHEMLKMTADCGFNPNPRWLKLLASRDLGSQMLWEEFLHSKGMGAE